MKKQAITLFMTLFSSLLIAQTNPNDTLRHLFSNLTFKNPSSSVTFEHLYDMSAHFVDESYYHPNSGDTNSLVTYFYLYESMYYASKDTTVKEMPDDYALRSLNFHSDTSVLCLMNYGYLKIKDSALSAPGYFLIDTVNNQYLDHPNPIGDPFEEREIFSASFTQEDQKFKNGYFRIDPSFMKFDSLNQFKLNPLNTELEINFDDGNGWIAFDQSQVSHHYVVYPDSGFKLIKVRLSQDGVVINECSSQKKILKNGEYKTSNSRITSIPGIMADIYESCDDFGIQADDDKKFIIYLEGIDVGDFTSATNRSAYDIYEYMIKSERIVELSNFGYSFVVVDWKNSRRDLRKNAMSIVALIDHLKSLYPNNKHEFVIIGESMGGLIGRYALTYGIS